MPSFSEKRVTVNGIWGDHEAVLDGVFSSIEPLRNIKFDLIILTVKAYDTEAAVEQVAQLVGERTLMISAQNGYGNYEIISEIIGRKHALLARIIFGVKLLKPGSAEVTVFADDVRIGQPHNAVDRKKILDVAEMFTSAGIPTSYAENVYAVLWDKILYNAAMNPLGAILECTYGQLAENAHTRGIMNEIIDEVFRVAQAHGVSLNWQSPDKYLEHFYIRLVPPTAKHYPSMFYDVKAGKRLEIDALNGAVVNLAREQGITVPVNETITALIKAKEYLAAQRQ